MEDSKGATERLATPTYVVAQRMRELRRARGWTAERLVDELGKQGVDWKPGVVTKLETGRRESVSIAEVLALACVFNVSPVALLLPSEQGDYAITPNLIADSAIRVIDWILGRSGLPFGEQDPFTGWFGIPAGLPEPLTQREIHLAGERDRELNALRVRNAELEAQAKVGSHTTPDELLSLLGRAERSAQEAERRAEVAELARQRQAALVQEFLQALPDEQRVQLGGLLTRLHIESQTQPSDGE